MAENIVADEKKVSFFLSIIGADASKLLKSYVQLTNHYKPKPLVIMERCRFQKRNQQESESVSDFIVALKQLSTNCDFGAHLDDDRFVSGLRSEAIQRKLLAETNVTFKSACETALSMEMASRKTLEFSGKIKSATNQVEYLGHIVDSEGLRKSESHCEPAESHQRHIVMLFPGATELLRQVYEKSVHAPATFA